MSAYKLMKTSIANKVKMGMTPEELIVEKKNYTKKANMFYSADQLTDTEYEDIMNDINNMVATKPSTNV